VPMAMPVLLLLPVSTILGAITFLGERPGMHVMFGGLIVIGGVAAVIVEPDQLRRLVSRRVG
jgi:O-acetylserine/cysteine efflux transporter